MSTPSYKVFMHHDLVDDLDEGFSPFDGIEAIDNVFIDLPLVHQSRESKRCRRGDRKTFRAYTGRLAWYPLGFTYIQIGNELHVVELWCDDSLGTPDRKEVDSVVGQKG